MTSDGAAQCLVSSPAPPPQKLVSSPAHFRPPFCNDPGHCKMAARSGWGRDYAKMGRQPFLRKWGWGRDYPVLTGNCAIFATKEVVSVTCTPTKGYTLALLRHLFGGISLVNVINRFSVCIAKIPQSPVVLVPSPPLSLTKWPRKRWSDIFGPIRFLGSHGCFELAT